MNDPAKASCQTIHLTISSPRSRFAHHHIRVQTIPTTHSRRPLSPTSVFPSIHPSDSTHMNGFDHHAHEPHVSCTTTPPSLRSQGNRTTRVQVEITSGSLERYIHSCWEYAQCEFKPATLDRCTFGSMSPKPINNIKWMERRGFSS